MRRCSIILEGEGIRSGKDTQEVVGTGDNLFITGCLFYCY